MLQPGLRLVFCGTAPSAISAREKAYYANPGNVFWKTLHVSGLTPTQLHPKDYPHLLPLGIGLTDLCKTEWGNDDQLPAGSLDPVSLAEKLKRHQPALVAFTSKYAGSVYLGRRCDYGMQPETLGKTGFYVCCSTSGRARRFFRPEIWQNLAMEVNGAS